MTNNYITTKPDLIAAATQNTVLANPEIQNKAKKMLETVDIPHRKIENWRHINIDPIFMQKYKMYQQKTVDTQTLKQFQIIPDANTLVFVNGIFQKELSNVVEKNQNIVISSMACEKTKDSDVFKKHFESTDIHNKNLFTSLNTAYSSDGTFVVVPRGIVMEKPLHIIHILIGNSDNVLAQNRSLFVIQENAQAKIVQTFHSLTANHSLYNIASEIILEDNAILDLYNLQDEGNKAFHVNHNKVKQQRASKFTSNTISLSGEVVRNEIEVIQNDEFCETELNGLYLPTQKQQTDNYLIVKHMHPHGTSNQLYRGVINDEARATFFGKVYVAQNAQQIDASQSNNNVLLSNNSRVNSKPQLEIYADDVSCTHGSATGQLDKDAIFYLQARGIGKEQAKIMMLSAFIHDVTNKIQIDELRNYVENAVTDKLIVNNK